MKKRLSFMFTALVLALSLGFAIQYTKDIHAPNPWMSMKALLMSKVRAAEKIPAYTIEMTEFLTRLSANFAPAREVTGTIVSARRSDGSTLSHFYSTGVLRDDGSITKPWDEGTCMTDPALVCAA